MGYIPSSRLKNNDLAPTSNKNWGIYNIFCFWMTDIHSVVGYITVGTIFAVGAPLWIIAASVCVAFCIMFVACDVISRPSQREGIPFPVIARLAFGINGAQAAAIIRGLIATIWYGIQTYVASRVLVMLFLRLTPSLQFLNRADTGFLGLSCLGWIAFSCMWLIQLFVFWQGMETIRIFIDFAGPVVYIVMVLLCGYLFLTVGFNHIDWKIATRVINPATHWTQFSTITLLLINYFSGPILNYGDFIRQARSMREVRWGNFLGLGVNLIFFIVLVYATVIAASNLYGTQHGLVVDPIDIIGRLDSLSALCVGVVTILVATVGINVVANFVSSAFDFSHIYPKKISWKLGGLIAACGSVFFLPWKLYGSSQSIQLTLTLLGGLAGPIFGIIIIDFLQNHSSKIFVDDLYTFDPRGHYFYSRGYNRWAFIVLFGASCVIAACLSSSVAFEPWTWVTGVFLGASGYGVLSRRFMHVRF